VDCSSDMPFGDQIAYLIRCMGTDLVTAMRQRAKKVIKEGIVNLVRTDCNATAWGERRDSHSLGHAIRTAQTRHLPQVFKQRDGTTTVGWTAASFARNPAPPTDEHGRK